MGTLNEDLSAIKEVEDKIIANKVARFAYTEEAYTKDDANGVAEYDVSKEQNIPTADASVLKVNETVLSRGYRAQASSVTRMLLNHFFGRMSYNLNKVNDIVSNLIATLIGHRGTANGFATLDENGRIPYSQLPESAMEYKGQWNAETNTPTLADGTGTKGDFYIVSVGGTQNLGSGDIQFSANDRIIYDGSVWARLSAGAVQTVNNISPENGNVTLTGENIPVSSTDPTLLSAPLTTDRFADSSVTTEKLANDSVTNAKIKAPISVDKGGTGVTTQADINKAFVNNLDVGTSDVTDGTEFVSSYASDKGFSSTEEGSLHTPYKRQFIKVWNYIKNKISSVLGLTENTIATLRTNADQGYLCRLYQPAYAVRTYNVILLGKIPDPASTEAPATPSVSWDIDVDFYFIRSTGHKAAWCNVKAGYGYSNAWRKYGFIETFGVDSDSNYTNPFYLVTVKYNNEYYIGVRHTCSIEGGYSARVKNVNTNGNRNPFTADGSSLVNMLKVIPYQNTTDDTVLNSEVKTSIVDFPNTYAPAVERNGDLVLKSGYVKIGDGGVAGSKLAIQGKTVNTNSYSDTNPKLEFKNTDGAQNISLTFNDFDTVQAPVSLTLNGNQGNEYFIAPNIKATGKFYGDLSGKASTAGTADNANQIVPNYTTTYLPTVSSVTTKYVKVADCTYGQTGTLQVRLTGDSIGDTLVINFGGGNGAYPMLCGHYSGNNSKVLSVIAQKGSSWNSNYSIYVKINQVTTCTVQVALLKGDCTINISESTTAPTNISEWPTSYGLFGDLTGTLTGNATNATNANNAYTGMVHTCSTASATKEKTVSIPGFTLTQGACIRVLFSNGNSAATPTLKVNDTSVREILCARGILDTKVEENFGTSAQSGRGVYNWDTFTVLDLYYDGAHWLVLGDPIVKRFYDSTANLRKNVTITGILLNGTLY